MLAQASPHDEIATLRSRTASHARATVVDVESPRMRIRSLVVVALVACSSPSKPAATATPPPPAASEVALESLEQGKPVHGFTPTAVYLDANDRPLGARLVHQATGFTLDYLRIESAPQGFLWVTTYPTSEKGEPHTQEHLVLVKGDRGRKLGSFEAMALAESNASTSQYYTDYQFHTVAGTEVFWPVFENQLDATLNPDYTDEEIRREVRNFGVDKADNGQLRLEEKGSVYNEMVRTYESGDAVLYHTVRQMVYGATHPLGVESGGYPDAIRTMTAADIRTFHDATYHLANMGMIAAFPSKLSLASVLDRTAAILEREAGRKGKVYTEADLPKPAGAKPEAIEVVDYPAGDTTSPSPLAFAWPATRNLDLTEVTLLDQFLNAFGGDESTNLYRKLVDSRSRVIDLGASSVTALVDRDPGNPVMVFVGGVHPDKLDPATIAKTRSEIVAELARIAKLPDGDSELVALNKRVLSRVVDSRRQYAKLLDTPPGFGLRETGTVWIEHLHGLAKMSGFKKSLTLKPQLDAIDKLVTGGKNPWGERLKAWGLLATPYAAAARPSPALRTKLDADRQQRIDAELARLAQQYGTKTKAATLAKYQVDYENKTAAIDAAAKAAVLPPLVDTPPLTLDDALAYKTESVHGVPAMRATVDSMQSARIALAFRLDAVPEADLMYLAALPELLSQVGVTEQRVIPSEEMRELLRGQVLELSVGYTVSPRSNRAELVVAGAGNSPTETQRALGWMGAVMLAPYWTAPNLPRLRDAIDQDLTAVRQAMQGPEEVWVRDPHDAWWRQTSPLHLHTSSFLTRAHDLHRLRWQLLDPGDPEVTAAVVGFLDGLAKAGKQPRAQLVALAAGKPPATLSQPAQALAKKALDDLAALVPELPDGSLAGDWTYLCKQMAKDLQVGRTALFDKLDAVRRAVIAAGNARVIEVGSATHEAAVAAAVDSLLGRLPAAPPARQTYAQRRAIAERLRDHDQGEPRYVGLVDPATSSGVFINSVAATGLTDTSDDHILDYLASNTYTGHGAHSLWSKTGAAGLAYSNGVHPLPQQAQLEYYAERCPLLPQTMRFVIAQLKAAKIDGNITRYAIAKAFTSRIAAGYEGRAFAMAGELVDGVTPDAVRAFREKVLAAAKRDDLASVLAERMPKVYGQVLPGYGQPVPDGVYFVIGPTKQLDAYQDYLRAAVGKDAVLHRLYPRDFWVPAPL
jgi:Zn-dependent M16 (insulinase) family peptidase